VQKQKNQGRGRSRALDKLYRHMQSASNYFSYKVFSFYTCYFDAFHQAAQTVALRSCENVCIAVPVPCVPFACFKQHRQRFAYAASKKGICGSVRRGLCLLRPAGLFTAGDLSVHFVRRSARASGIRKDVHMRKTACFNERRRLPVFLLRFARKAYNEIGGKSAAGKILS